MVNKIILCYLVILLSILMACAPKPPPAFLEAKPGPEVAAKPAPKTGWEAEWEKILKEATKEGTVVFHGPPFAELRLGLAKAFEGAYPGIRLDYIAMRSAEFAPRVKTERAAGVYRWDMSMGGTFNPLIRTREFITPIPTLLMLPEVKDPKVWLNQELQFADKAGKLVLNMVELIRPIVVYNSDLVNPGEIASFWDLVKPKWKGKIIMQDPRESGTGMESAVFWYLHPQLGLEYIKAFAANKPVFTRDFRFVAEWTGRGKYAMGIATDFPHVEEFQKAGLPLKWLPDTKEGTFSSSAGGSLSVMDKAPHPNAVMVFLNWLLTKEGQTIMSRHSFYPSRRIDVPTGHLIPETLPKPGVSYLNISMEEIVTKQPDIVASYRKIFD